MVLVEGAQDPFYQEEDVKSKLNGRREKFTPLTLVETIRSFNKRLIKV